MYKTRFNTSHVVIYRMSTEEVRLPLECFNTSHVVIYRRTFGTGQGFYAFQYISCCYLSKETLNQTVKEGSFNTSHVVIYLSLNLSKPGFHVCFNTSHVVIYLIDNSGRNIFMKSFNTSHVVIYHIRSNYVLSVLPRFNTSHVVIYRRYNQRGHFSLFVSIHLMLLFISEDEEAIEILKNSFNTSHVVIYLILKWFFQILLTRFNTSHVVIYPTVLKHFFFSLFPFTPYFKAFSEILPAFFHFYIFLFIIAQPPCIYGLFSLFSIFSAGKISSNKYLYSVFAIHLIILNNQVFPIFTTCISNNFFSKYVVIHQFNNTHEILFVVYNLF